VAYERLAADLWFRREGALSRVRLDQTVLEFSGLGDRLRSESRLNWDTLVSELRSRAPAMIVDTTMIGAKLRQTQIDAKYVDPTLAKEFDAVRKVAPDFYEFYSALRAWTLSHAPAPEMASGAAVADRAPLSSLADRGAPADAVASVEAVPAGPEKPSCPRCWGEAGAAALRAEWWHDAGVTFTMKQKYLVQSVAVPGLCPACVAYVRKWRLVASLLAAAPAFFFGAVMVGGDQAVVVGLTGVFFYGLYLLRWGEYCWADRATYGLELEQKVGILVPQRDEIPGNLRFPVGCLGLIARIALFGVTLLVGVLVGAVGRAAIGG
jgi:hypothetical protein